MTASSVYDIPARDEEERKLIVSLDDRLQRADIDTLGWRGRQDLSPVMQDLKKLSLTNWPAAEALWDRNDGELRDKPDFLDKRSHGVALADVKNETNSLDQRFDPRQSAPKPDQAANEVSGEGSPRLLKTIFNRGIEQPTFEPPEAILKRFLRAGPEYYFRDDEHRLAFKDDGKKLQTPHNEPRVALAMVEMAQAHGWETIKVKGSDEFRREAWLQASLRGLEVHGYKPNDMDRAMLDDKRATQPVNELFPLTERETKALDALQVKMRGRGDSDKAISQATAQVSEKFQQSKAFTGVLMEHGRAPYENNAKNPMSYFVRLDTKDGERTVWGSGLARAMAESGAERGQNVAVAATGRERTPITSPGADGQKREVITTKTLWSVAPLDRVKDEQARYAVEKVSHGPSVKVFDATAPKAVDREIARKELADMRRNLGLPGSLSREDRGPERTR